MTSVARINAPQCFSTGGAADAADLKTKSWGMVSKRNSLPSENDGTLPDGIPPSLRECPRRYEIHRCWWAWIPFSGRKWRAMGETPAVLQRRPHDEGVSAVSTAIRVSRAVESCVARTPGGACGTRHDAMHDCERDSFGRARSGGFNGASKEDWGMPAEMGLPVAQSSHPGSDDCV